MNYVIDPGLDPALQQKASDTALKEAFNQHELGWYFMQCQQNRELLQHIEVVVPVRPADGTDCALTRMLSIWYGEGTGWSHLNDHMGGFIELTRANICYDFVNRDRAVQPKYLLMIDNDMQPPVNLPYLLARHDLPVVAAVALHMHEEEGPRACFTVKCKDGQYRFPRMRHDNMPKTGVVKCGHVGTGAVLIRRDVLEAFTWKGPEVWKRVREAIVAGNELTLNTDDLKLLRDPDIPFIVPEDIRVEGAQYGRLTLGEDLSFCEQVRRKGFDVFVDLEAHCGHVKKIALGWDQDRRDPNLNAREWTPNSDGQVIGDNHG